MKAYRCILDFVEEVTTSFASVTFVNSKYTQDVYKKHFPLIQKCCRGRTPSILYPAIDFKMFDKENKADLKSLFGYEPKPTETIITSLNRYERKKDIPLALKAVAGLNEKATLVVAGGYDERVIENVEHHLELVNLAKRLGINVVFLRSISSEAKVALLKRTNILLYTP